MLKFCLVPIASVNISAYAVVETKPPSNAQDDLGLDIWGFMVTNLLQHVAWWQRQRGCLNLARTNNVKARWRITYIII